MGDGLCGVVGVGTAKNHGLMGYGKGDELWMRVRVMVMVRVRMRVRVSDK